MDTKGFMILSFCIGIIFASCIWAMFHIEQLDKIGVPVQSNTVKVLYKKYTPLLITESDDSVTRMHTTSIHPPKYSVFLATYTDTLELLVSKEAFDSVTSNARINFYE